MPAVNDCTGLGVSDQGSQTTPVYTSAQACHRRALLRRPARVTGARIICGGICSALQRWLGSEVQRTWNHRRVRASPMEDSDLVAARVGLVVAIAAVLVVVGGRLDTYQASAIPPSRSTRESLIRLGSDRGDANGWVYNIRLKVDWFSADGTMNDGSRPSRSRVTNRPSRSFDHRDQLIWSIACCLANLTSSFTFAKTAPRCGVPATVMPRPRRNSSSPSSRNRRRARRTVFVLTPRTVARSLASGMRSPGRASPSAIARRSPQRPARRAAASQTGRS